MKAPKRIQPLIDDGLVDEVLRSLMSGKEAQVYLVRCGDETRCAKVYKEVADRSFKKSVLYQEGRKIRNSRRQRAMEKRSKFGRDQQEVVWQRAEVDALYLLAEAGVRVPKAYGFCDGVLLMELITDADGEVAPRLNDITLSAEQAVKDHTTVMNYVLRMLCVGLVHGDLSEFNVLQNEVGPVIIDLPQAVNAAGNNNAKRMLQRDVGNITQYYSQYAPELADTHYAEEIWDLHEKGELHPDLKLTGAFEFSSAAADVDSVLHLIDVAHAEEQERRDRMFNG
ncbi:RIO1 family protein [Novipirellula galeiformis]|uniref:non-specific serine/threonine protein kinase n=1 Tax=Novipirellula galeiformis TaxID=2528004 RepID=A0A5C6CN42_9BACT|nr:PA4780 family RIO1-like protein kinase [Novipirellula galeiformis]TWU24997.1 RIO1 family protein [Novipirellula galeiformis]